MQLLQLQGVVTPADKPHYRSIYHQIEEHLDQLAEKEEEHEEKKPWWKKMLEIDASQRMAHSVADTWLHELLAPQIRTARKAPTYKKLKIYDFDGTTFRSPHPPDDYEDDDEAWWSDPRSLGPETVGEKPGPEMWHEDTVRSIRDAISEPDTYVVVMTGRHNSLQDRIQEILESNGLKPDEVITNPNIGDTQRFKRYEMAYLLRQFPNVREVEFWEDRKDDLKGYERLANQLGVRFVPKYVPSYEDEPPPYVGVFLDPETRKQLLRDFKPKHENVEADHVTIAFRPSEEDVKAIRKALQFGSRVPLKITGYAEDDKGQALTVELPPELAGHARRSPHITLSIAPGVEPVYSNELIQENLVEIPPRTIEGTLDGGPRQGTLTPSKSKAPEKTQKQQIWEQFLQEDTRNPEYGRGGRKETIKRKTLYDSGGAGRRQVMREWGPYLQKRRGR